MEINDLIATMIANEMLSLSFVESRLLCLYLVEINSICNLRLVEIVEIETPPVA